jgi:hypothetical protein
MSTHDEKRLSRSLHDRAGDVTGAPLGLAEVQRRARGIQRRRRIAGGLVAAGVVVAALPVALNLAGSGGASRPVAPATTSPSSSVTPTGAPTATPSPPQDEGVTPLTVNGAPEGAPAAVTYLRGSTVVVPGSDPVELPAAYDSVAPYRGGWLAVERRQGTPYVVHLDASGRVSGAKPGGDRIVVSQDGVELSWAESGRLYLDTTNGHSEQPQSIALPKGGVASPVGFTAPGTVVARVDGPRSSFWVTNFTDLTTVQGVVKVSATDEAHGVLGVQTSANDDGTSCWAVRSNAGNEVETRTCDWQIVTFSPDGKHLVGYPSDSDGIGAAAVRLLDTATAKPVTGFARQGTGDTYVSDVVWEDASHALASLHEGTAWYLVRLGLDGSLEKVDEAPGSPEDSPFHFAAHP